MRRRLVIRAKFNNCNSNNNSSKANTKFVPPRMSCGSDDSTGDKPKPAPTMLTDPEAYMRNFYATVDAHDETLRSKPIENKNGTFANPWPDSGLAKGFCDVMKWKFSSKPPKFPSKAEAAAKLPSVATPDFDAMRNPQKQQQQQGKEITLTWCSHVSFLIQVHGINMLTDPVWSKYASPFPNFSGPKRMVDCPIALEELPRIHVVTLSHNHYDHLDYAAVSTLVDLFNPFFVVPKGMRQSFFASDSKLSKVVDRVIELNWWESCDIFVGTNNRSGSDAKEETVKTTDDGFSPSAQEQDQDQVEIFGVGPTTESSSGEEPVATATSTATDGCARVRVLGVPARHWCIRSGFDRDSILWCGFVSDFHPPSSSSTSSSSSSSPSLAKRVFFVGDTGYCQGFREIGHAFNGAIDLSLIPIGAYEPRWFMHNQHTNPHEAVRIHRDVKSKFSIGMHWGTFILTDEPIDDPPKQLRLEMAAAQLDPSTFVVMQHGETLRL